ncbi:AAA family ATPase [Streptomyces sp. CB01881]|uniref:AAA family ATPase n=1 Tax=Streptomyces sp. CB01881 TaxID=2078691 RepID=UPI001F121B46|nr:AAA family ATPase [Streptomyces sp. CB01881]
MTDATGRPHPLSAILAGKPPRRDTFDGWQHYRANRRAFEPAPVLTLDQWRALSPRGRALHDLHRTATHVNLPLQETPMAMKVSRLLSRRILGNALQRTAATWPGVMVGGWGYQGKTETVCEVAAEFEDTWLEMNGFVNPGARPGVRALHAPVAYVQTPVTATPKGLCEAILGFFGAPTKGLTLPQLVRQVAAALDDHGVLVLILDDITRLRLHRVDDQDAFDLVRAFMSMNVTLVLVGVDIAGSGLLRRASWDKRGKQWVMPAMEGGRVHGLEVTQTERRFDFVELDRFRYTTPAHIQAFHNHLVGLESGLRLFNAGPDMLVGGGMPEYLMRRTGGVVGLLNRLIEDGAHEAMDSGRELIDEELLDGIVLSLDDPGRDPAAGEVPRIPATASPPVAAAGRKRESAGAGRRGRNTVFDDTGPVAQTGA